MSSKQKALTSKQKEELLAILKSRFEKNQKRHKEVEWKDVEIRLSAHPEKLWSLNQMQETGGEPDVVGEDKESGEIIFVDCSPESPIGRRGLCYDRQALDSRKEHKPEGSVVETAVAMGIELLTEDEYRDLQNHGEFDKKTSSWVRTPADIRKLGGALFCDYRYGKVFVYHNGAQSYYAVRGFRGRVKV